MSAILARWTESLHVPLPVDGDRVVRTAGLSGLALRLDWYGDGRPTAEPVRPHPRRTARPRGAGPPTRRTPC
ncbi:hypothetical protein [Streptomyces sp. AM 2-1-1]|uniref:hypothetical protein n=1 Tax=Streptomyces sp. AM 2-1-1 TaxID=3028709 RepID=UPI0031BA54CB